MTRVRLAPPAALRKSSIPLPEEEDHLCLRRSDCAVAAKLSPIRLLLSRRRNRMCPMLDDLLPLGSGESQSFQTNRIVALPLPVLSPRVSIDPPVRPPLDPPASADHRISWSNGLHRNSPMRTHRSPESPLRLFVGLQQVTSGLGHATEQHTVLTSSLASSQMPRCSHPRRRFPNRRATVAPGGRI